MDLDQLLAKRIVFITGKGGTGKTSVAAALGAHAAAQGKQVCIVEYSAEEQLAPLFGIKPVGHNLVAVAPNLHVFSINAELNFRDFIVLHLGFEGLFERVFSHNLVRSFVRMIPGIAEITFLGRLYYMTALAPKQRMDLVIVDGFASGHFLSLMTTPDAILRSGLTGPIINETQKVRDYLANPDQAAIAMVTHPGALVTSETQEFVENFRRLSPVALQHLFLNRAVKANTEQQLPAAVKQHILAANEATAETKQQLEAIIAKQANLTLSMLAECGAFPEPLTPEWLQHWLQQNGAL